MANPPEESKIIAMAAFWAQAGPKGRCKLSEVKALLPEEGAPEPDNEGLVGRPAFLAWIFGKPEGSTALLGETLLARGFQLLKTSESEPKGLDLLWPSGTQASGDDTSSDRVSFIKEVLDKFRDKGPSSVPGHHFLAVVGSGLDPNNVPFPWPEHMRKQRRVLGNLGGRTPPQPDVTPFLLPHGCDGGGACREMPEDSEFGEEGVDAECAQEWVSGLAKHIDELRTTMHEGSPLDMELEPWPQLPDGIIAADECVAEVGLRAGIDEGALFVTDLEPWPQLVMDAVARDDCTKVQLQILADRQRRGPLSDEQRKQRCARSARRMVRQAGQEPPPFNELIFGEVLPVLEKGEALEQMRERRATDAAHAMTLWNELAQSGGRFCAWPVPGERRWPPVDAAWKSRGKWLAAWRERQEMQKRSGAVMTPALQRSNSASSDSSWLAVSDISWIDIESRASESGWETVVGEAEPSLQEAKQALDCLCKADVQEMKALHSPPIAVKLVMDAVCVLFGLDPSWEKGKKLLGDPCFLQNLINAANVQMRQGVLRKLERYIADEAFQPEKVKKSSVAAEGMCRFICNAYKYNTLKLAAEQAQPGIWKPTEEELVAARMPGLEEAAEATKGLKVSDLQELRSLRTPPPAILKVLEATQYLLACVYPDIDVFPTGSARKATWASCMKMIRNLDSFLTCLHELKQAMDDGQVLQANVTRARAASQSPLTCDSKLLRSTSGAAAALARYNLGMIKYFDGLVVADPSIGLELKAPVSEKKQNCGLTKGSVQELKNFGKPPQAVIDAVVAVVLLAGMVEEVPDWKCCQRLMGNPQFIRQVEALGKDSSPNESALSEVRKIAAQENFTVKDMALKSAAAACMVQKVLLVLAEADAVALH
mmetsp:Transcript_30464/g.58719  ORF Transcript_30464/g.58719 Transcript_30464/m.58719 type:complete len:881 (-) Transcript_30464:85-2727(-)